MNEFDEAYHRARERACRDAAARAATPQVAAIHLALADKHRAQADSDQPAMLYVAGNH